MKRTMEELAAAQPQVQARALPLVAPRLHRFAFPSTRIANEKVDGNIRYLIGYNGIYNTFNWLKIKVSELSHQKLCEHARIGASRSSCASRQSHGPAQWRGSSSCRWGRLTVRIEAGGE
jgi:hypothetical protein